MANLFFYFLPILEFQLILLLEHFININFYEIFFLPFLLLFILFFTNKNKTIFISILKLEFIENIFLYKNYTL